MLEVTSIEVNEEAIRAKIENLLDDATMTQIQTAFAKSIDPWVPYDTGRLSKDLTIDAEGVTYNAPYAFKNYYGDSIVHKADKHPLATAYWDKVAMFTVKDELTKQVEDILKRKAKELNG